MEQAVTGSSSGLDSETAAVIEVDPSEPRLAGRLASELGVSPMFASVLIARGLRDASAAEQFLAGEFHLAADALNEVKGAAVLADAVRSNSVIAVHGDYDCDGVCSTAILTLALRSFGASVIPRVPERVDGYGLSVGAIDELRASGAQLLIAVDCGITSVDEVAYARSLGMDVVIVDHHRPRADGVLPEAVIVHPNLRDPSALAMCAAAVAHVLIRSTASELSATLPDSGLLELAALATVTDLMPLVGVNRTIVQDGLKVFPATRNAGLSALLDAAGIDRASIDARALGFGIGPRVNAAGRVRSASAALELLLCAEPKRATELAENLCAANLERREIQQRAVFEAEAQASDLAESAGWVLASPDWHAGVVGIVAGSLAGKYHRPVIVLAVDGDNATGSARSVPGYSVAAAIEECSDLLERHGGHSAAAGLTIRTERIDEFRTRFASVVERTLASDLRIPRVTADLAASPAELTLDFAEELSRLEPTGEGNRPAIIAVSPAQIHDMRSMGKGQHARFRIAQGSESASAVVFGRSERLKAKNGDTARMAGRLEVNRWNGVEEPRFSIELGYCVDPPELINLDTRDWVSCVQESLRVLLSPNTESVPTSVGSEVASATSTAGVRRSREGRLSELADRSNAVFVVGDLYRRRDWIAARLGSVTAVEWAALTQGAIKPDSDSVWALLDPPADPAALVLVSDQVNIESFRLWTDREIRFAMKLHEAETDVETGIRQLYAEIRDAIRSEGGADQLIAALKGTQQHPRTARQVGAMLAVLSDIGAIDLAEGIGAISLSGPTDALENSAVLAKLREARTRGLEYLAALKGVE